LTITSISGTPYNDITAAIVGDNWRLCITINGYTTDYNLHCIEDIVPDSLNGGAR